MPSGGPLPSDQPLILIVDDEADLRDLLAYNLLRAGFEPLTAVDGADALRIVASRLPSLVLLDQMMPRLSGTDVLARWRREPRTATMPVIMLTARDADADQVAGLNVGADDYITKPFSMPVLLARIRSTLRRGSTPQTVRGEARIGPLRIDRDARIVRIDDEPVSLTATEFRLLLALADTPGSARSRIDLMQRAIGPGVRVTARTIDVHMAALRKKLGRAGGLLETVRGYGYRMSPPRGAPRLGADSPADTASAGAPSDG